MSTFRDNQASESGPSVDYPDPNAAPEHVARSTASNHSDFQQEAFSCGLCEKNFNRRENLSRHLKTHNTPSHCCSICGKGFTRSDLLKRHEAGHERWDRATAKTRRRPVKRRKQNEDDIRDANSALPDFIAVESGDLLQHDSALDPTIGRHSDLDIETYQDISPTPHVQHPQNHLAPPVDSVQDMQRIHDDFSDFPYDVDMPFEPFDFSSFLIPQDITPLGHEWFSFDFYSAMRETGNELGGISGIGPSLASAETWGFADPPREQGAAEQRRRSYQGFHQDGPISRISSPPNEASEEDKWPFQWNPNSQQILSAHPISVPGSHPLFHAHDPRFDISEATLSQLESFLYPQFTEHPSTRKSFVLPPLNVVNLFIGLFFKHFSPQMPVLHHATINTNKDLPPPLIAAMIIIGAIYSRLKHTRRFAIVLLDATRWHLQVAVECNNAFMRSPMIIYAQALIVHTGLWCGNKRAFELAEVGRGALVTYIRRIKFGELLPVTTTQATIASTLDSAWRQWVQEESQKRLAWVVYTIDSQFPGLLNLPPTISVGEVRDLGCPCDEEFWAAGSARSWKHLLGPATVPPSRSFSAAVGPFVLGDDVGHKSSNSTTSQGQSQGHLPVLNLNPWSAFLVLTTITPQIHQITQEYAISRNLIDHDEWSPNEADLHDQAKCGSSGRLLNTTSRSQMEDSLQSFASSYLSSHHPIRDASTEYFTRSSHILHRLSTILLYIPLPDLQNAIGKDGTVGITQAMSSLSSWARPSSLKTEQVAQRAVQAIMFLSPSDNGGQIGYLDTAPYSLIAIFLCHVILWVFVSVSAKEQRAQLLRRLELDEDLRNSSFISLLRTDAEIARVTGRCSRRCCLEVGRRC
ncbi:hypothetical protein ONS96_002416 [Cadophora gregata f. sp. sojae]|nr:hypothetical protein ONS96_002416 [Cadophora gregata f. sp. sojae]